MRATAFASVKEAAREQFPEVCPILPLLRQTVVAYTFIEQIMYIDLNSIWRRFRRLAIQTLMSNLKEVNTLS